MTALGIWGIAITFNAVDQFGRDLENIGQGAGMREISGYTIRDGLYVADPTYGVSPAPRVTAPVPSDFVVDVKILEKKCFGSAGCNVSYQIVPSLANATDLASEFQVIYEVTGGENGPQINNMTVHSGGFQVSEEEFVQTASSGTVLKARVTGVRPVRGG